MQTKEKSTTTHWATIDQIPEHMIEDNLFYTIRRKKGWAAGPTHERSGPMKLDLLLKLWPEQVEARGIYLETDPNAVEVLRKQVLPEGIFHRYRVVHSRGESYMVSRITCTYIGHGRYSTYEPLDREYPQCNLDLDAIRRHAPFNKRSLARMEILRLTEQDLSRAQTRVDDLPKERRRALKALERAKQVVAAAKASLGNKDTEPTN